MSENEKRLDLAIDFDGVLNTYTGWKGDHLYEPREGVVDFLKEVSEVYNVIIHTTREASLVANWLSKYDLARFVSKITKEKPPAIAYIDDRAIAFNGDFNEILKVIFAVGGFKTHWEDTKKSVTSIIEDWVNNSTTPSVDIFIGTLKDLIEVQKQDGTFNYNRTNYGLLLGLELALSVLTGKEPEYTPEPQAFIAELPPLETQVFIPDAGALPGSTPKVEAGDCFNEVIQESMNTAVDNTSNETPTTLTNLTTGEVYDLNPDSAPVLMKETEFGNCLNLHLNTPELEAGKIAESSTEETKKEAKKTNKK